MKEEKFFKSSEKRPDFDEEKMEGLESLEKGEFSEDYEAKIEEALSQIDEVSADIETNSDPERLEKIAESLGIQSESGQESLAELKEETGEKMKELSGKLKVLLKKAAAVAVVAGIMLASGGALSKAYAGAATPFDGGMGFDKVPTKKIVKVQTPDNKAPSGYHFDGDDDFGNKKNINVGDKILGQR